MTILSWFEHYGDNILEDFDLRRLRRDECFLQIQNKGSKTIYLYSKYKQCTGCPYFPQGKVIEAQKNLTIIINTLAEKYYRLLNSYEPTNDENSFENVLQPTRIEHDFGEFGVYAMTADESHVQEIREVKEPVSIYFPMITVALIYLAVFILVRLFVYGWDYFAHKDEADDKAEKRRVKSLDTFRGISIVLMIFVNYGHGGFTFLGHAPWDGLYIGDLVFPWFMWIMGVCIPMSIKSITKRKVPFLTALYGITKRSVILFALGLVLGSGTNLDTFRIFGVLQRFAITYFVVATLLLIFPPKFDKGFKWFQDIIGIWLPWVIIILIVLVHTTLIMYYVPPECPSEAYFGPGGYHLNGTFKNCTGGVTGYVDRLLLGQYMYQAGDIQEIYGTRQLFDPEGVLGCLTSIFHVFLGAQAGMTLLVYKKHALVLIRWVIWGVICGIISGALCYSEAIPINKNLWSLSFVFLTSCIAFVLLSLCYVFIDWLQWWGGKPFLFAGMNAIVMYVGHSLTYGNFPFNWTYNEGHKTHFTLLISNIEGTSTWVIIAYLMYRKKNFVSI